MVNLNRRQLLLTGLATGVASTLTVDVVRRHNAQKRTQALEAIAEAQLDTDNMLEAAFQQENASLEELRTIRASVTPLVPPVPYDRAMSKLLILCNKLTTQQYIKGKVDPSYDGSIDSLPTYGDRLNAYTQVVSFKGTEAESVEQVEITRPANVPLTEVEKDMQARMGEIENSLEDTIQEVVKLKRTIPVYYGFVLESEEHSLVLFRGTQRRAEWLENITALLEDYTNPALNSPMGQVHTGFHQVYKSLVDPLPLEVFRKLDPAKPCYVSGHSLGGAIAILAALDAALQIPQLQPQLRLYTYANPRVGNIDFVNAYHQRLPNNYRIVNLADTVPLVPPTKLNGVYAHVGQKWAFLSQNDDLLPNHQIDIYRHAIDQSAEQQAVDTTYTDLKLLS